MSERSGCAARRLLGAIGMLAALGAALAPSPAAAWWRGGFLFGYPVFVPPPVVVVPPPTTVAPPAYAPGATYGYGPSCTAVNYVCPLDVPRPIGAPCSCRTNNGGRAGGIVQ